MRKLVLFILLSFFLNFNVYSEYNKIFIKEDFNNLKQWMPLKFDKIDRLTMAGEIIFICNKSKKIR